MGGLCSLRKLGDPRGQAGGFAGLAHLLQSLLSCKPARCTQAFGATLGLVIGGFEEKLPPALAESAQAATKKEAGGLHRIAGCVLLNDLSLPHASYYRPPIKFRNRDGFLGCGPVLQAVPDLSTLALELRINGTLAQRIELSTLVRDAATLLRDVSEFMTLQPGDVLMLGTDCLPDGTRPRAKAGDRIEISAPDFAPLVNTLVEDAA